MGLGEVQLVSVEWSQHVAYLRLGIGSLGYLDNAEAEVVGVLLRLTNLDYADRDIRGRRQVALDLDQVVGTVRGVAGGYVESGLLCASSSGSGPGTVQPYHDRRYGPAVGLPAVSPDIVALPLPARLSSKPRKLLPRSSSRRHPDRQVEVPGAKYAQSTAPYPRVLLNRNSLQAHGPVLT